MSDKRHTQSGAVSNGARGSAHKAPAQAGFTLIEMLTVITIIGIIAALTVPVLKNFGKSDISVSASRQLLDDIGHARQLAMAQRTTVYMVFVPTNFWIYQGGGSYFNLGPPVVNQTQLSVASNLLGMQLAGYNFLAKGAIGDQPGQHQWHYLSSWRSLPDGAYIPLWKFFNSGSTPPGQAFNFSDPANNSIYFNINAFPTNTFPIPTDFDSSNKFLMMPYIAFNYLGQLCTPNGQLFAPNYLQGSGDQDYTGGGIDIPVSQGSLVTAKDPTTRQLQVGSPQVIEIPPGNTTNISFNVVHIDPLTGRATLLYHKMQ